MKSRFGTVFALVALLICGSAVASTIKVPADQPTIQDGINATFHTVLLRRRSIIRLVGSRVNAAISQVTRTGQYTQNQVK
jgi:hypothetical protein